MPGNKSNKKGKETPVVRSGRYVFANGDRYEGEYEERGPGHIVRSGRGTHTCANGTVYSGQWQNDILTGIGEVKHPSGAIYTGDIVEGVYHGEGTYEWPDGSKYTGIFNQNRLEGRGVFTDTAGREWAGEFTAKTADRLRLRLK